MSLSPAIIDAMLESGCTAEQLAAVMKAALAGDEARLVEKRAKDAERQRRHRASRDVTVTDSDSVTSPALSPFPNEINSNPNPHTHPEGVIPCARKADPFPRPAWCPAPLWADFLANRKAKRLKNTATAYAGLLADIDRLTDDEWPPPRLLEHATAKGWGAVYDPRGKPRNDRAATNPDELQNPYARRVVARQAERAAAVGR